jgi:hypothetical protein
MKNDYILRCHPPELTTFVKLRRLKSEGGFIQFELTFAFYQLVMKTEEASASEAKLSF